MTKRVGRDIVAGLAVEDVRGVINTLPAIYWLRILSQPHYDKPEYLPSQGSIGTVVDITTNEVDTLHAEGGLEFELNAEAIVLLLWSAFGTLNTTQVGSTDAYEHVIELDHVAERKTLTYFVNELDNERAYPLFVPGQLNFNFALAERPSFDCDALSKPSVLYPTTPVFADNPQLFRPKDIKFYLADDIDGLDTATKIDLKSMTLSLNTNNEADFTLGEESLQNVYQKTFETTLDIEMLYDNNDLRDLYTSGTPKAVRVEIINDQNNAEEGAFATGTITVVDYTGLTGDTITVGSTVLTEGVDFDAETSNDVTATNIASAIDAIAGVGASAVGAVVTVTASVKGTAGNAISLATNAGGDLTLSGANLAGGVNPVPVSIVFDFARGYFIESSEDNGRDDLKKINFQIKFGQNLNEPDIQFCQVRVVNAVDSY